jgi:hypothetical protein
MLHPGPEASVHLPDAARPRFQRFQSLGPYGNCNNNKKSTDKRKYRNNANFASSIYGMFCASSPCDYHE